MPKNQAKPRLQMADIAHLAGVSISTVSRALDGNNAINEKTRLRIQELSRSLGYSINASAKSLRLGDSKTVGVVIPYDTQTRQHISDPFFLAMLGGIADALTEQGYELLLSRVDSERLDLLAEPYNTGRAKGIIVIGQWHHHDQLNELALRKVPMVVWGAHLPRQLYCTIGSDNATGGYLATRHLLQLGRRKILFLGDIGFPEVALRYDGYLRAHRELNLAADAGLLLKAPLVPEQARPLLLKLCGRRKAFDAVFAASDLLAMMTINVLIERGFEVPKDVCVTGYDDIGASAHFNPALTTIRQPTEIAGQMLVEALLTLVRGEQAPSKFLPTELIIRASTQPVTA